MIFRSMIALLLIYVAAVLQICCSKWIPHSWGRPQLLLLMMIFIALRDRTGLAVVISAGIGFLADSLEPSGMGRFFLLYSMAGWWLQRRAESGLLRLSRPMLVALIGIVSFLIPMTALILGLIIQPQPIEFQQTTSRILATSLWTMGLAFPCLILFNPAAAQTAPPSNYHRTNHWNMLTNS